VVAHNEYGNDTYFFLRHLAWVCIGLAALFLTARLDYHVWPRLALPVYLASLLLLTLILIPGVGEVRYGSARWLALPSELTIQPSELAKLALVIYLASWLARVGEGIRTFSFGAIPFALIVCVTLGLVLLEPNLGTAVILGLAAASVFFVAGASPLHGLAAGLTGAVVLGGLLALAQLSPGSGYWADRIQAFVDPWAKQQGLGWQTTQTLLALGSGGMTGLGLETGRQKFYWVPNAHTDSIFAIVGEEIGFAGTALVLLLFLFLGWRGLMIAYQAPDRLGRLLGVGVTSVLLWQALLNMAVVTNTVPYTGVPLPFLSYGGSSMLMSCTALGILLSVSRQGAAPQRTRSASWFRWARST
jgi:cell division protein FtsW